MSTCVVKGCTSKSFPGSSLRFYSFPGNPTRRQLWLSKIKLKGKLSKGATICGLHFGPEDYDKNCRLREYAIPGEARPTEFGQSSEETITWDDPDAIKVCRICLAADRKMFDLRGRRLQQAYFDVTGITPSAAEGLPRLLCWECAARVAAAAACRARAHRAHAALTRLLHTHGAVTMNGVCSVNRRRNRLTSELARKVIYPSDFIYVNRETEGSDIKINNEENEQVFVKFTEYVDDHAYDDEDLETKDRIDPIDEAKGELNDTNAIDRENEVEDRKDLIAIEVNEIVNNDVVNRNDEVKDKEDVTDDSEVVNGIVKVIEVNDIVKTNDQVVNDVNEVNAAGKNARKAAVKRKRVQTVKEKRPPVKRDRRKADTKTEAPKYLELFTVSSVNIDEEIAEVQKRKESDAYKRAPYKCDICYRSNIVREKHKAHMLKHTEKYGNFECVVCRTRYKTELKLRHHMTNQHTEKYSCNECTLVTRIKTVASNHYKYHNGIKYKCPHCPREFDRTTTYYGHLRVKHACDFVCEYCGHTFLSTRGVLRHKSSVHKFDVDTTPLEGPRCDTCDVTFASEAAHARHLGMSSKHNNHLSIQNDYRPPPSAEGRERRKRGAIRPGQPITCEQCGTTLPDRTAYAYHFRKAHRGETRTQYPIKNPATFMCEQCGRKFQCMALLRDHKRVHAGVRDCECRACGKSFLTRMTLYAHARTHRAARAAHACAVCGKQFSSHGNRDRHMLIHTGLKPFECEACGKRFGSAGEMRAHIDHVHNKKPWPKRQRRRTRTET